MMSLVQNSTKVAKNLPVSLLLPSSVTSSTLMTSTLKREPRSQRKEPVDSLAPPPPRKPSALREHLRKMPSFNLSESENSRKKYNSGTLQRGTKSICTDDLPAGNFFFYL